MRVILVTLAIGLVANLSSARAEDFTGFYAGVNAGYASGRQTDRSIGVPAAVRDHADSDDESLPPSALTASQALQAGRDANAGKPARR